MATYESNKYSVIPIAATQIADGSVSNTEFQHLDGAASDLQPQITARLPLAGGTMTGDLNLGDNVDINFGASTDLKIFHDGSDSIIQDAGTGDLVLAGDNVQIVNSAQSKNAAVFTSDGSAALYHNNSKKLETTSTGVTITGTLNASLAGAYPIGSIYMNITSTDPNTLLGFGTWARFGEGKMLISQDTGNSRFDVAEETGGSESVTLTTSQIPGHTHTKDAWFMGQGIRHQDGTDAIPQRGDQGSQSGTFTTDTTGGGQSHDNMPPFIVVYMWKRTA